MARFQSLLLLCLDAALPARALVRAGYFFNGGGTAGHGRNVRPAGLTSINKRDVRFRTACAQTHHPIGRL